MRRPASTPRRPHAQHGRGNPVSNNDPTGHCPAPSGEGNTICVAGFIPTETSTGIPGAVYFIGDNRDFSSNSPPDASRFWVWLNADTGEITNWNYHGTQRASGPNGEPTGALWPPRNVPNDNAPFELYFGSNYLSSSRAEDSSITLKYKAVCSDPICNNTLAAEGRLVFQPNDFGTFDTHGNVDAFPNLEAYHWSNGSLRNDYLFQMQNYTVTERVSGHGNFPTSLGMTYSVPFSANFVDANQVQMHIYRTPIVYVP